MTDWLATVRCDCLREVRIIADTHELMLRKAEREQYEPITDWTPIVPAECRVVNAVRLNEEPT